MAYSGPSIALDELLYRPKHSLIRQSVHSNERREPLNGDGWGVGWYAPDTGAEPALYRTINPAWSDLNMKSIAPHVRTPLYFAHVRAATPGLPVHQFNCHPFTAGPLMFMHNGRLGGFPKVRRSMRQRLSDDLEGAVMGTTDSELAFATVQQQMQAGESMAEALESTISIYEELKQAMAGAETTYANFVITDGESMAATRYVTPEHAQKAASLYIGRAGEFHCTDGVCSVSGKDGAVVLASERLFDDASWQTVPANHTVIVDANQNVTVRPMQGVPMPTEVAGVSSA